MPSRRSPFIRALVKLLHHFQYDFSENIPEGGGGVLDDGDTIMEFDDFKVRISFRMFGISDENFEEDWNLVRAASSLLGERECEQISQSLRGCVKMVLLEDPYICRDHKNLVSNFYTKKFRSNKTLTQRLHFFSDEIEDFNDLLGKPKEFEGIYLGFTVIRPVIGRTLGKTYINHRKIVSCHSQKHYCLAVKTKVHFQGHPVSLETFPHLSQDGDVTVCAHSALWGVCRYLSMKYDIYKELYPFDLISMTGVSNGRTFPYRGMTYADYSKILSDFGAYPIIIRVKNSKNETVPSELWRLYTYLESGFPIIVSLRSKAAGDSGHAVTVIGHTIKKPTERQIKSLSSDGFVDSSVYVDKYIISDDNEYPFTYLGKEAITGNKADYRIEDIYSAVCPLPEKVYLESADVKDFCVSIFRKYMSDLVDEIGPSNLWVTRLFLTTCTAFKRKKYENGSDEQGQPFDDLSFVSSVFHLPHFIWVMELGRKEDYENGHCCAELVIDSTASPGENYLIYRRFGSKLVVVEEEFEYKSKLGCKLFKQYRHNLGD